MERIKATIYKEKKPEYYSEDDDFGITISVKKSNEWKADILIDLLKGLDGWDIRKEGGERWGSEKK